MPGAHDIVTILVELQVKPDGIVRTATETVISFMVAPRVYYLLAQRAKILTLLSLNRIIGSLAKTCVEEENQENPDLCCCAL